MMAPGEVYRHYKGKLYKVIAIARHSETLEDLVVYECLYENPQGKIWARPIAMWNESVEVQGKRVPRFTKEKGE